MLGLWETLGQAFLDTNFRRYRIRRKKDSIRKLHDRINKLPGRHSMSRFEVGEVLRVFRIKKVVKLAKRITKQWNRFCTRNKDHIMYPELSVEFKRALGLAATDRAWVARIIGEGADTTENVHFEMDMQEKNCLVEFLRYTPEGRNKKRTAALLKEFELAAWTSDCWTSVTKPGPGYEHPIP